MYTKRHTYNNANNIKRSLMCIVVVAKEMLENEKPEYNRFKVSRL